MKKLILLMMCVFLIGLTSAILYDSNLTAYWNFDESSGTVLEDIDSGVGNGTLINMTNERWVAGISGNALNFTSLNQTVVELTNNSIFYGNDVMSLSVWIKSTGTLTGSASILGKDENGGTRDYKLILLAGKPTGIYDIGGVVAVTGTQNVNNSNWKHLVFVNDGTDLHVYVDGALNKTDLGEGGAMSHNTQPPLIGGSYDGSGDYDFTGHGFDGLIDEMALFDKVLNTTEITELYNSGASFPFANFVVLDLPATGSTISDDTIAFNATLNGGGFELANATLNIWNTNGTLFNQTTNTILGTGENSTFYNISNIPIGNYVWNVEGYRGNGAGSNTSSSTSNFTFVYGASITAVTNNTTSFQTQVEQFTFNVTIPSSSVLSAGSLFYDGTGYAATVSNSSTSAYSLTRTIDIPGTSSGATSFSWNYTIDSIDFATSAYSQTISDIIFTLCNATYTVPYVNISFNNETIAEENTNATIVSTWNYWIGTGTAYKTYSLTNATENINYEFCFAPNTTTVTGNVSLLYDNDISEQRNWETDFSYTNTSTAQSLFLLPTADGIFVTFQVVDGAEQVLSDVAANVTKSGTLIASDTTNDAGTVTFFLDPDTSYIFTFSKATYSTFTTTLTPTLTEYTVNLGLGTISSSVFDFTKGMTWATRPLSGTSLTNNTNQEFTFTLDSSFWTVSSYGFTLTNSSGHTINSTSAATNGGTVSVFTDTLDNTQINMNYFWVVSGNTTNGSTQWVVFDGTGTGFGLTTAFDNLKTYTSAGLFGLGSFGLTIIVFLAIFTFTGIMSWKFGFTDTRVVAGIALSLVLIFDAQLGLLPKQGLATAMLFIINIAAWIREGTR